MSSEVPKVQQGIAIPSWRKLSSGVWAPSSVIGIARPVPQLPKELNGLVDAPALAAPRHQATSFDQIAVKPTELELGIDPLSASELVALTSTLPFAPSAIGVARLAAALWHAGSDGAAQLEVAQLFFQGAPIMERYETFLRQDANRVLFSEQQLFLTCRLLVLHATDDQLGSPLSPAQMATLGRVLLAAGTWADVPSIGLGATTTSRDLLAYFVQNGSFYARPNPLGLLARTFEIFIDLPRQHPEAMSRLSFESWIDDVYPLGLEEQLAAGFALFSATGAADPDADRVNRSLVDPNQVFGATTLAPRTAEVAATFALPREDFRALVREPSRLDAAARDATAFMQHPFVRLDTGQLLLWSPRALLSWLSDGVYYRLLDIASARTTKKDQVIQKYTSTVGMLLEQWALRLVRSAYPGDRLPGGGVVHGDLAYGRRNDMRTPDVLVDLGEDLVAIEVRSGYLRRDSRTGSDPDAVMKDIDSLILKKVGQLHRRVTDILRGEAPIPGVDPSLIKRVWPILVSANVTQPELLYDYVAQSLLISEWDVRIQAPVLMDPEALEALVSVVEAGESITAVLGRRQATEYVKLELARWLNEAPEAARPGHPSLASRDWEQYTLRIVKLLGLPPPAQESRASPGGTYTSGGS